MQIKIVNQDGTPWDGRASIPMICEALGVAFGGDSQVPLTCYGQAVAAHLTMGTLVTASIHEAAQVIGQWLSERWPDNFKNEWVKEVQTSMVRALTGVRIPLV